MRVLLIALFAAISYAQTDTCEIFEGVDIVKGTFSSCCAGNRYGMRVESDEECQARCTADPDCNAWVTTTPEIKKRKCYMTSGDVEWEADSKRNGGLPCDTDTCPIFERADIVKGTFHSCCGKHGARVESDEECQALCTAHPVCKAWVTNSPEIKRIRCYMTSGDVEWEDDSSRHGGLPCVDCAGVRGGSAVKDACGVCDGDGSSCADLGCGPGNPGPTGCDNQCGSTMENLGCGCGQPGPTGCDNQCGSTMEDLGCGCGQPGPSVDFGCVLFTINQTCNSASWDDVREHCGECKARVSISPYTNCANYCEAQGLVCISAYEDVLDNCEVESFHSCDESVIGSHGLTKDVICECQPIRPARGDGSIDGDEEDVVVENQRLKKANSALLEALKSLNAN